MAARPNNNRLYVVVSVESTFRGTGSDVHPIEVRGVYDSLAKANQVASRVTSAILASLEDIMPWDRDEIKAWVQFSNYNGLYRAEWTAIEEWETVDGGHHFEVEVKERVVNDDGHEGLYSDDEDEEEESKTNRNRVK